MAEVDIVLINANRMQPLVAPLGLDYLAGALREAGFGLHLLDLALADDPEDALLDYFAENNPHHIGITIRNTDDCFLASRRSFIPELEELVGTIRSLTDAPLVLGGCGYSLFPEELLLRLGAEWGIVGDGEEALVNFLHHHRKGKPVRALAGIAWRGGDSCIHRNPPAYPERISLSCERSFVDNARYSRQGGQGGLETKRGCSHRCIYCANPVAKGRSVRRRDPDEVAREARSLLRQGVEVLHICDPEFNVPLEHATGVCVQLIERGLADRLRWYAYCSPAPFTEEWPTSCVGRGAWESTSAPIAPRTNNSVDWADPSPPNNSPAR